jgi:hypothetical protein
MHFQFVGTAAGGKPGCNDGAARLADDQILLDGRLWRIDI